MQKCLMGLALAVFLTGGAVISAHADGDHPTVRAAGRYANRKVAHVDNAAHHVKAHYKNWKQRKGHNTRAWLNKH